MNEAEFEWAIEAIDRQSRHLTRLVDDLLEISRITTGKLELRRSPVALETIIQGAVEISQPLIEQFAHRLKVELPTTRIYLDADATRLSQVFANLLNNAAKYTERDGLIELCARQEGDAIVVSVKDSGMGIPPEMLPSVFDMFTQVDRHLERSQGGLGIGLSLVKRLVELHDGSIAAYSQGVNQGSEFVVRIPAQIGADLSPGESSQPAAPAAPLRILIVDDNQDNAKSLGILLQLKGNEVRTAFDGQSGLEVAEEFRPDAVLLDIGMPKLNGYETCKRIREQSWGKKMILIAQTGFGQFEDRQSTMNAGFDHHLVKPVNTQDLMHILANCV
jgi:CheY-like chemotaxis protein